MRKLDDYQQLPNYGSYYAAAMRGLVIIKLTCHILR